MHGSEAENGAEAAPTGAEGIIEEPSDGPDALTSLLENYGEPSKSANNNTAEPYVFRHRPGHLQGYGSFNSNYAPSEAGSFETRPNLGDRYPTTDDMNRERAGIAESIAESVTDGLLGQGKKKGTTYWLAKRAGIRSQKWMYVYTEKINILPTLQTLIRNLGTSTTTFPSRIGRDSTAGASSRATSSPP
jgi:hypothetical protein